MIGAAKQEKTRQSITILLNENEYTLRPHSLGAALLLAPLTSTTFAQSTWDNRG